MGQACEQENQKQTNKKKHRYFLQRWWVNLRRTAESVTRKLKALQLSTSSQLSKLTSHPFQERAPHEETLSGM